MTLRLTGEGAKRMDPRMAIALLMVASAMALAESAGDTVTVCMGTPTPDPAVPTSRVIASQMFRTVGVEINWVKLQNCPPRAIRVTFQIFGDDSIKPGTLAYALPYEGSNLVVFYDRIRRFPSDLQTSLLAHVLVHEIAHLLEGTARHSTEGVMKALWTLDDYTRMIQNKPLLFTRYDAELIHTGIEHRAARALLAPH
jgi:hypothetical protein